MVTGEWSGKLVDATGIEAVVQMDFKDGEQASWQVQVRGTHGFSEPLSGTFSVAKDDAEQVRLSGVEKIANGTAKWEVELNSADAGNHAAAALLGRYQVTAEDDELPLKSGVLILWQYR